VLLHEVEDIQRHDDGRQQEDEPAVAFAEPGEDVPRQRKGQQEVELVWHPFRPLKEAGQVAVHQHHKEEEHRQHPGNAGEPPEDSPIVLHGRGVYFFRYLSSQAKNVRCHSTPFWGFSTQWFSSGKKRNWAGMPRSTAAL